MLLFQFICIIQSQLLLGKVSHVAHIENYMRFYYALIVNFNTAAEQPAHKRCSNINKQRETHSQAWTQR